MSETEVDLLVVKAQTADTFHDTEDDHRIELEARPTRYSILFDWRGQCFCLRVALEMF